MCASRFGLSCALFCCLLALLAGFGSVCAAEEIYAISENELQTLNGIFQRLETLNENLQNELTGSLESLRALENELQTCKAELEAYKADLTELQTRLTESEQESAALREQLQTVQALYEKAVQSLNESLAEARSRINSLNRQRNLAVAAAFLCLLLGVL